MRRTMWGAAAAVALAAPGSAGSAAAQAVQLPTARSARDLLTQASFEDTNRDVALRRVSQAQGVAGLALARTPQDGDAALMQATALGYRAKLTGSRGDAVDARRQFEALVSRTPRNPEAWLALGAWHVGAVYKLGGLIGRSAVGARKATGIDALDRAVALGGNRAFVTGLSALLRLEIDPADPKGRMLAEATARAATPTALDRILQRGAAAVLVAVRTGDARLIRTRASRLLPFGQFGD